MTETLSGVNGQIIRWARERYNMTPEAAAVAIGIDSVRYVKWENGEDFPTYAKLKVISDVFNKPSAIFFFPEPPNIPPATGDLRTLSMEVIDRFSKQIIVQFEKARAYQSYLNELYQDSYCMLQNREQFPKNLEQLASHIRKLIAFPVSAQKERKSDKVVFEIFRQKLYNQGIYVFKDAFKDNSVSGLCINDNNYPVIILNNAMSFSRQSFTLFHELYHLISNTSGAEIIRDDYYTLLDSEQSVCEKACDEFANEFLVPINDFKLEISNKKLDEVLIAHLASLYSVSKEAIMYKLYKMGLITSKDYNKLKEIFYGDAIRVDNQKKSANSSGGNYYYTKISYLGNNYTGTVFQQYFSGKIDSYHASEMLNSKVDHLPQLEKAYFRGNK